MRSLYSLKFKVISPLLFVYRWFNYSRRFLVKGKFPEIPVVAVGNIAFGGTGKTPVTIALASYFMNKGKKVGVVTRGYKSRIKNEVRAYPPGGDINPYEAGDEASVIRENLKGAWIFVGKKREEAVRIARRESVDLLILDDGFQYLSLKKIEIVLHSLEIPTFYLREPISALKFADYLLLPPGQALSLDKPIFHYRMIPGKVPEDRVFLFCGIANPEKFFSIFDEKQVGGKIFFPDHMVYNNDDLDTIYEMSEGLPIITTEKDYVKVKRLSGFKGGIFPLTWRAELDKEFLSHLEEKLKSLYYELK